MMSAPSGLKRLRRSFFSGENTCHSSSNLEPRYHPTTWQPPVFPHISGHGKLSYGPFLEWGKGIYPLSTPCVNANRTALHASHELFGAIVGGLPVGRQLRLFFPGLRRLRFFRSLRFFPLPHLAGCPTLFQQFRKTLPTCGTHPRTPAGSFWGTTLTPSACPRAM